MEKVEARAGEGGSGHTIGGDQVECPLVIRSSSSGKVKLYIPPSQVSFNTLIVDVPTLDKAIN